MRGSTIHSHSTWRRDRGTARRELLSSPALIRQGRQPSTAVDKGPDDIQDVAGDVLRHRLVLSFEAEAAGVDADEIVQRLVRRVPVP